MVPLRAAHLVVATLVSVGWGAPASAQLVATPYLHANFGDVEVRRGGVGLSLGYLGRWVGLELDASFHSHFYRDADLQGVPDVCGATMARLCIDSDTDAVLLTSALVVPLRLFEDSGWSLYGSAGPGLIHAWIHGAGPYDSSRTYFALSAAAGVAFWPLEWLGIRAEGRYHHAFVDEDVRTGGGYYGDFDFVRVSLGVTFAPLVAW